MSDYKQCSDAAQTGPGVNVTKWSPKVHKIGIGGPVGNTKSGSSQGDKRGKTGE